MSATDSPRPAWWRRSPLAQLSIARLKEFFREPAAVFWVYGFPLLLAVALGIAGLAAYPVNHWLIARGRGHAVVHAHHH